MWVNKRPRGDGIVSALPVSMVRRMDARIQLLDPDPTLIRRFDRPGPRYTSYPTADRFVEAFDAAAHVAWLARSEEWSGDIQPRLERHI